MWQEIRFDQWVKDTKQIEGIGFDETFAPISRLESLKLLIGMSCLLKFKLYKIDVKSAFHNGLLNEEVYAD